MIFLLHPVYDIEIKHDIISFDFEGMNVEPFITYLKSNPKIIDSIECLIEQTNDAEAKARLYHFVYYIRESIEQNTSKHRKLIESAVNNYLLSGKELENPDKWTSCLDRYQLGFKLAMKLGWNSDMFKKVVEHILSTISIFKGLDNLYLTVRLLSFLLFGNALLKVVGQKRLKEIIDLISESCDKKMLNFIQNTKSGNDRWDILREYHFVLADYCKLIKSNNGYRSNKMREVACYIFEAKYKVADPTYVHRYASAIPSIEKAIKLLQKENKNEKVDEYLFALLGEYEKRNIENLKPLKTDMDITEFVKYAKNKIYETNNRIDGLKVLVFLGRMQSYKFFAEELEKHKTEFPFTHSLPYVMRSSDGRVIAMADDEDRIFESVKFHQRFNWIASIQPALEALRLKYIFTRNEFRQIVRNSPFVPYGREEIFEIAFLHAWQDDFLVTSSLLIPQIENSLRYILEQHGINTTRLSEKGIRESITLNSILNNHKDDIINIFGEENWLELSTLLISRFGWNLRNDIAHGLSDSNSFFSEGHAYLFWFTLKLVLMPIFALKTNKSSQ